MDGASNLLLEDCLIAFNHARDYGPATSGRGGGLFVNTGAHVIADSCLFVGNAAAGFGGHLSAISSSLDIRRCVLSGGVGNRGGAIYLEGSQAEVTNCTLHGNTTTQGIGTVHIDPTSFCSIRNSILWANSSTSNAQIYDESNSSQVQYSDIQFGYPGLGNIDADPLFVNAANGNFHLTANSPCIDSGDQTLYDPDCTISDMGAYFYFHLAQPENLVIQQDGNDMALCWSVVDSTDCAMPSPIRSYVIYYEEEMNENWDFLAATQDTCYRHENVIPFSPASHYYYVVATDFEISEINQITESYGGHPTKEQLEREILRMSK